LHWLGGYIVMSWAPSELSVFEPHGRFLALTPVGFALAVAATLGMSAAFAYLLEAPIERIRHRFAVAAPGDPKRAGHPPARS
jgi:peptidoglycan/LPS O-acetylase OafA/YrhL